MLAGLWSSITDVPGIRVGHAERIGDGWLSGVTVVLPPPGTVGAVDVRGGGPATRETDALEPTTLVPTVDAVVVSGGSAYGLAAAHGVQAWCEEEGLGFPVGPPDDPGSMLVPIVPAAAIFDLGRGGDPGLRPGPQLGQAAAAAAGPDVRRGAVGAGTGALIAGGSLKGGVGTACVLLPSGIRVGALAVVNAFGSPIDPTTGGLVGAAFVPAGLPRPALPDPADLAAAAGDAASGPSGRNTTIAVVATDAALDPPAARRAAACGHDGLARAVTPVHTLLDGDTVFALATGRQPVDGLNGLVEVQAAAADAVLLAVLDAVLASRTTATALGPVPGYLDRYPSAEPGRGSR